MPRPVRGEGVVVEASPVPHVQDQRGVPGEGGLGDTPLGAPIQAGRNCQGEYYFRHRNHVFFKEPLFQSYTLCVALSEKRTIPRVYLLQCFGKEPPLTICSSVGKISIVIRPF